MGQSKPHPNIIKEKIKSRLKVATHCRSNDDGKKHNHSFLECFFSSKEKCEPNCFAKIKASPYYKSNPELHRHSATINGCDSLRFTLKVLFLVHF